MTSSPNLSIRKFRLWGKRKNYDLPFFNPGLNIVYGSTDTGKSMILRLIAYALGKKSLPKRAAEIDSSCTHILLETEINGKIISIKRNILRESDPIEIFYDTLENIAQNTKASELYHIKGTVHLKPLSEFLLEKLGIPRLMVPYAPNDPSKGFNPISIKDVINLIYLDDEQIGGQDFLGRSHPNKHIKYIESLKVLLKLEDARLQGLQLERALKNKEKNELQSYLKEIKKFLLENNLIEIQELAHGIYVLEKEIKDIEEKIDNFNKDIIEKSEISKDLNNEILSKKENIAELQTDLNITLLKIKEFSELREAYLNDLKGKEPLLEINYLNEIDRNSLCPVCNKPIESENIDVKYIAAEISELKYKIKDLEEIIKENEKIVLSMNKNLTEEKRFLKEIEQRNSVQLETYLSPLLESRDKYLIELGRQKEVLINLKEKKRIVEDYEKKENKSKILIRELQDIDSQINSLKKEIKGKSEAISEMTKYFAEFIKFIEQASAENPKIDQNFVPRISTSGKEMTYYQISGTAKKVVVAVAYYTALLKYRMNNSTFLPNILIIDSPSTGRGNNPQDPPEKIDIAVYNKMFEYWSNLIKEAGALAPQIILVDNAAPPEIAKKSILVTFDRSGESGKRKGLIDDIS